jgi:hypothetical protein
MCVVALLTSGVSGLKEALTLQGRIATALCHVREQDGR